MILSFLLIIFCFLSLLFSLLIIVSKNPIHSILYLILVFCSVTFILIILGVEFIAITFLIVYVGAIAVLFLFVVMMLNIKILELDETF
jgi:NADH:ubiquinone oxidoreductase subunit 6 (subunit J)